jgi:Sec-independent protein translocase protein TatA
MIHNMDSTSWLLLGIIILLVLGTAGLGCRIVKYFHKQNSLEERNE